MKKSFSVLVVICGLTILPQSVLAESKSQAKEREAAEQQAHLQRKVTKVLQGERMGVIPDRQKALRALIESGNAPDEAYWQAGYVKKGDQWVSVEARWLTKDEEAQLDEYAKVRNPTWNTPEANYDLAKWCDQHGLQEQARAHLMSILLDHPDNAELRQMLGYQKIGNRWMNEEEFNAAVEAAESLEKDLQKWGPIIAEIREGLDSADARKQNAARIKLEEIDDLDVIPLLELILLGGSENSAAACVKQLSAINHRDSTLALCRAAMFLPESMPDVKNSAIEEIRQRPYEDYVPTLLTKTADPMSYQMRFFFTSRHGNGRNNAVLMLVGSREGYLTHEHFIDTHLFKTKTIRLPAGINGVNIIGFNTALSREDNRRTLSSVLRMSEKQLESMDEYQTNLNHKISGLISAVTHLTELQQPKDLWLWWSQQDLIEVGTKPDRVFEAVEFGNINEIAEIEVIEVKSCFVAGTPVWTERGPRPIEKLHIGDMILTKDVESGELAYKPIIRTTVREPKPLVKIDLGPEQITATLGHPFWVSGTGWVKARDLKPGQWVHTPTGSIEVVNVTEADEREVYNLVVDGFHTYFVGQSQLLCHDISITSPTDAVVPGLIER